MLNIGIVNECTVTEKRVAATPETVAKMLKNDFGVVIETGSGNNSYFSDNQYQEAGAKIFSSASEVYNKANIFLRVSRPPHLAEIDQLPANSIMVAPLSPRNNPELLEKLSLKQITAFSLDLLPRIARAQSMDILSSMSSIAGYKSIILASSHLPKLFPMMMTAAGTITPAKVIVIGAGVAGLQAIATARRLGGSVLAFDTRPVVAEQVKSLGADFVSLETSHDQSQDKEGYAKEQSAEFYRQEQEIISKYLSEADVVITTALIPGKRAPLLITANMVKQMKPGSVIVDLAIEQQGNCESSKMGEIVNEGGVTIIGLINLPSTLPYHASQLYSRNLLAFLNYITSQIKDKKYDFSDDIIKSCLVTCEGKKFI